MASVEFIKNRIEGKQKEIDKLTKKLARIRKVEAQNWEEPNPYYYSEYDLKSTLRDIEEAEKALACYKAQLTAESEKANSRNVPAIVEFLDGWKARMTEYYTNGLTEYYNEKQRCKELYNKIKDYSYGGVKSQEQLEYEEAQQAFRCKCNGYYEKREYTNRWGKTVYTSDKVRDGEYEWLRAYTGGTMEEALRKLEKDLTREWARKYDFIIERTNAIVGTITDAANLKVGAKGDLNGYIVGTRGTAKIQTIGAGGYNIQCFHFRTLIDAVK